MLASVGRRLARALAVATTTTKPTTRRARRAYGRLSDPNTFELLRGPEGRVVIDKCVTFARTRRRPRELTSRLARSYDARGFAIKGAYCVGSVFAYDGAHAAWSPRRARDITPETLAALEIVDPTPDLLIVGTGRAMCPLREDTLRYLKEIGVAVDACDTIHATSTFNVLVEEGRCVAAALLPAGHEEADER